MLKRRRFLRQRQLLRHIMTEATMQVQKCSFLTSLSYNSHLGSDNGVTAAVLRRCCGGAAAVLRRCCGGAAAVLRRCCGGPAAVLRRCCGGPAAVLRRSCGGPAAVLRRSSDVRSGGGFCIFSIDIFNTNSYLYYIF
jgi:hypothetical protein